jgi:hypothetical protein
MQKTTFALLGLLLSIAGTLCAQQSNQARQSNQPSPGDRLFEPPAYSIGINYRINLGAGNILQIDLANGYDLHTDGLANIDSILNRFLDDMQAFRDSIGDPLTVKHIDYLVDTSGNPKLRIRQYHPVASSFLLDHNGPSILRVEQDTIRILIVTAVPPRYPGRAIKGLRYDRFCFFVNHYEELESYAAKGLNAWTHHMISNPVPKHPYRCPFCYTYRDTGISSRAMQANGLGFGAGVAVQNYKSYFAPAFTLGGRVHLARDDDRYIIGASWEPIFLFAPDSVGHLTTYRNDFVVVSFTHFGPSGKISRSNFNLIPDASLGYLFHSSGAFFDKPSFRLSVGDVYLHQNSIHIEPELFFDHFFKAVTPGLRVSIGGF